MRASELVDHLLPKGSIYPTNQVAEGIMASTVPNSRHAEFYCNEGVSRGYPIPREVPSWIIGGDSNAINSLSRVVRAEYQFRTKWHGLLPEKVLSGTGIIQLSHEETSPLSFEDRIIDAMNQDINGLGAKYEINIESWNNSIITGTFNLPQINRYAGIDKIAKVGDMIAAEVDTLIDYVVFLGDGDFSMYMTAEIEAVHRFIELGITTNWDYMGYEWESPTIVEARKRFTTWNCNLEVLAVKPTHCSEITPVKKQTSFQVTVYEDRNKNRELVNYSLGNVAVIATPKGFPRDKNKVPMDDTGLINKLQRAISKQLENQGITNTHNVHCDTNDNRQDYLSLPADKVRLAGEIADLIITGEIDFESLDELRARLPSTPKLVYELPMGTTPPEGASGLYLYGETE